MDIKTPAQWQLRRSKRPRQQSQLNIPAISEHSPPRLPPLTEKNLLIINSESSSNTTVSSGSKTTSSNLEFMFAMEARRNGILELFEADRPTNSNAILKRLHARWRSKPPTKEEFEKYRNRVRKSMNENTTAYFLQSHILNLDNAKEGSSFAFNQPLNGIPKNVGFNYDIPTPQTDSMQGLDQQQFHQTPLEQIPGALVDTKKKNSIVLPHMAGEWKKLESGVQNAEEEVAYDGAALMYTRNRALEAMGTADRTGRASVITFTTNGRVFDIFAHYTAPSKDGKTELNY